MVRRVVSLLLSELYQNPDIFLEDRPTSDLKINVTCHLLNNQSTDVMINSTLELGGKVLEVGTWMER